MSKTTGWVLVAIAFVALLGAAYLATRHSQKVDAVQTANQVSAGAAYDATTGAVVPANAQKGTMGTPPSQTVAPVVVPAPATGS